MVSPSPLLLGQYYHIYNRGNNRQNIFVEERNYGFVTDFSDWPYSSYAAFLSDRPTRLPREKILAWFGGTEALTDFHLAGVESETMRDLIGEDYD